MNIAPGVSLEAFGLLLGCFWAAFCRRVQRDEELRYSGNSLEAYAVGGGYIIRKGLI